VKEDDLLALLELLSVPGIGPGRIRRLLAKFRSPSLILEAGLFDLLGVEGIDRVLAELILKKRNRQFAERQLEICRREGIDLLTVLDPGYPENLKEVSDAPVLLYLRGSLRKDDRAAVAVVGTRMPSSYGRSAAERITRELVQHGLTIVSGLARGIDTVAHRSALANGGRTLAVLGCGLDRIYPPENRKIAERITESGALISEFPCGTGPDAGNFPRRNRIISALSLGVLIVEAGEKSGALITADTALDQGREVFAVPGEIFNSRARGTNRLIQQGAKLVQSAADILEELSYRLPIQNEEKPAVSPVPPDLSEKEKRILEMLSEKPVHIDAICQHTGFSPPEALSLLLTLELKQLVRQLAGKLFVRT